MLKTTRHALRGGLLAVAFAGSLAGSLAGCAKSADVRPGAKSAPASPGLATDDKTPVARIGNETITNGDLNAFAKQKLSRVEAEFAQQVHGIKQQSLDELVEKRLIDAKAKAEGITPEALVKREVDDKITAPTDAEAQALYDKVKASGRPLPPFEQVKDQVFASLKQQKSGGVRKEFIDRLEKEAKVEKMLPPYLPPKVEVAAEGPSKGDDKAPITIVEFSDYECPYCSRAEKSVDQVMEAYKGKVRVVFRDYPLPFHHKAQKAHEAAHCAADEGKYWQMHGKLFANQSALDVTQIKGYAKEIGLDQGKFDKCLDGGSKAKLVEASKKAGEQVGVTGTPAFFINGRMLSGAQPFEEFKKVIDAELAQLGK